MQCCTCSKWVHLSANCSPSKFRTLGSSHTWSCDPTCHTVTSSSDSSGLYTSTVESDPHSPNALLPPHPRFQIYHPPSDHFESSPSAPSSLLFAPGCSSTPPASSPPCLLQGFFNGILAVFEPGALNCFTFFCPILLTLSVSRNPILTHLPLFGFLDSLLCILIVPTPGLAFSFLMRTHASSGVIIFVRQGLFSELSTSSLSLLDPYSDYVGVNISLNNFSSVSFLNVYPPLFALPQRMAKATPFLSPFFPPEISSLWGTSIAITPSGTQKVLPTRWEERI